MARKRNTTRTRTVGELISELEEFDPNLPIVLAHWRDEPSIEPITVLDKGWIDPNDNLYQEGDVLDGLEEDFVFEEGYEPSEGSGFESVCVIWGKE